MERYLSQIESSPLAKRLLPFDGMRGIAAIGVSAYHVNPSSPFLFWAWTFVDMFFVLSGFLIGSILYRGISEGTLSLKNFWIRRILRIWPVYYLTLAMVVLVTLTTSTHTIPLKELMKSMVFLQFTGGYLHPGASWDGMLQSFIPSFGHSWSIAAEEQFYLLLPVLLWMFGVGTRGIFIIVVIAIFTSQMLLHANFVPGLLGTRMQGMALGLLLVPLSQWLNGLKKNDHADRYRALAIGIILLSFIVGLCIVMPIYMQVASALGRGEAIDRDAGKGLVHAMILGMALIYFAFAGWIIAFPRGLAARVLSTSILVYLGSVSYAVYMLHVPVRDLLVSYFGLARSTDDLMVNALYWLLILVLAHLSKALIENRFNALKDHYPVYTRS